MRVFSCTGFFFKNNWNYSSEFRKDNLILEKTYVLE